MTQLLLGAGPGSGIAGGGGGAGSWLPSALTTLKLWLKGDSNTGSNGSAITTWADASGLANDATGVAGPTLVTANLNGLNVVRFTSASLQYFTLPNFLSGFAAGSVIWVAKTANDGTAGITKFGGDVSLNGNNSYGDGSNNILDDFGTTARRNMGTRPVGSLIAWHIASFHAAAGDMRMYLNGGATAFFTTATNTVGWRTPQPLIGRGARSGGGENYLNAWIAELIFVNEVLATGDRNKLEGYLAYKWGIQSVLPGGHPYKTTPP